MSRVYSFDLAGAGVGCLLVVFVMSLLSPPGAVAAAVITLCLAGVLFAIPRGGSRLFLAVAVSLLVAGLGALAFSSLTILPSPEKFLHAFLTKPGAAAEPGYIWSGVFRTQIVRRSHESFVPWAWGINGCASVVGTVLSVVLAMSFGFRAVTLIAVGIYALGVLGLRASARRLPA